MAPSESADLESENSFQTQFEFLTKIFSFFWALLPSSPETACFEVLDLRKNALEDCALKRHGWQTPIEEVAGCQPLSNVNTQYMGEITRDKSHVARAHT